MKNKKKESYFEHVDFSLSGILKQHIKDNFIKKDWSVLAIDIVKDRVVFQRFENNRS